MGEVTRTDTESLALVGPAVDPAHEVITPREVPLGGPRAMTVRRTLPNRSRTTIGAWCFLDHYGPDSVAESGGMSVPPHPHTGLQTVSWLFEGEIEHRDSTGAHAMVVPGELNLMTAGRGIQHSEVSTPGTSTLHGVQLWVALPEEARHVPPRFDAARAVNHESEGTTISVFLGSLPDFPGVDVATHNPLVAAELRIPAGGELDLRLDSGFEHGLLVDEGHIHVGGTEISRHHLGYFPPGTPSLPIRAGSNEARVLLIGGTPFDEQIVMWWNFVGRTHDDIALARAEWQEGLAAGSERFGHLSHKPALPAPELPGVTLKARGNRQTFPPGTRNTLKG